MSLAPDLSAGVASSKEAKNVFTRDGTRKSKRIGRHRKEDPSGNIFYKKAPQDHISGALQLGTSLKISGIS